MLCYGSYEAVQLYSGEYVGPQHAYLENDTSFDSGGGSSRRDHVRLSILQISPKSPNSPRQDRPSV